MTKITKEEFESIKMVYQNIYFAHSDHEYLSEYKLDMVKAAFIDQNQTFFKRVKYYLFHFTIIELYKVFYTPEKHSLGKYINYAINDPENHLVRNELVNLKETLNKNSTKEILSKIYAIRKKVSAHLDLEREEVRDYPILVSEIELLMSILENFVRLFSKLVLKVEYSNPITGEILGYKLHRQYAKSITIHKPQL